jgi:hypothetical protein
MPPSDSHTLIERMIVMSLVTAPHRGTGIGRVRWLVWAGLMPAIAVALALALLGSDVSRECRSGVFSSGLSSGFDVKRCDLVLRRFGDELFRLPVAAGLVSGR